MWLLLSLLLTTVIHAAEPVKVAVIDTGFDFQNPRNVKLCKTGHWNFLNDQPNPLDDNGHGTHVAGLIAQYAGEANYCIIALKYYDDRNTGKQNLANGVKALKRALKLGVKFVNYSGGGPEFDEQEYIIIRKLLKKGVVVLAAAGNEKSNIDIVENYYYPASYDKRIHVVGATDERGMRLSSSNYGKRVSCWEQGYKVKSILPYNMEGVMTGTSQATAIHTGKMIKEMVR